MQIGLRFLEPIRRVKSSPLSEASPLPSLQSHSSARYSFNLQRGGKISDLIHVLSSLPAIERLDMDHYFLKVYQDTDADTEAYLKSLELLEAQDHLEFSLNQLQEVKFEKFCGSRPELEFVKFLSAKSSALKTMCIQPFLQISTQDQLKVWKEIIRFQRAWPNVEIIICDNS